MKWTCKFCTFFSANQRSIIRHYKLKHGHYSRSCPLPCIYKDCVCSFNTQVALKNHLLKHETVTGRPQDAVAHGSSIVTYRLHCEQCEFSEPCTVKDYFVHLWVHLKNKETLKCPFQQCLFKSDVYSTYTAHRSRYHSGCVLKDLRPELIHDLPASGECDVTAPTDIDVSQDDVLEDEEFEEVMESQSSMDLHPYSCVCRQSCMYLSQLHRK